MARTGRRVPDVLAVPPLDTRLDLRWAGCERSPYRSRVEEHSATVFGVLAPLTAPGSEPLREGSQLSVTWQTPRGVHRLRCELVGTGTSGPSGLWWLVPVEPVAVVQRRSYVRVPASLVVRLDGPFGPTAAVSVDISEGGFGCRLTRDGTDPWVFSEVTVPIDDEALVAGIRTVRVAPDPVSGRWSLGAGFVDLPRDAANRLRRHVFERQVALRKVADRAS